MNGIVYKVTNLLNNKIYIGKTSKTLEDRKRRHYYDSKRKKTHFHLALLKYSKESFSWEILRNNCQSLEELNFYEMLYISMFNSNNRLFGYNVTNGGEGILGFKFSEESKKKLRESQKEVKNRPEYRDNQSSKMKDKWKEPGYKERISKSLRGKKRSLESRKRLSEAKKGEKNPQFGKSLSEETRDKLSKSMKGKSSSWLTGRTAWNKGKTDIYSEEIRKSVSEKIKKLWEDPEYRKHMSLAHKKDTSPIP